jgi:hypothetical protein
MADHQYIAANVVDRMRSVLFMLTSLAAAPLLGAAAIPRPAVPPWQPNAYTDSSKAQFDQPNVRISELAQNGGDVVVSFRIELFRGDPDFPDRVDRGMIFVQLDGERGAYLAVRTRPEEDSAVAFTGLAKGLHRVVIQLVSAHAYPSTIVRCFTVR